MIFLWIVLGTLFKATQCIGDYYVGAGIADVTGPPAEAIFLGYGSIKQRAKGLHLRQFSRAFIFHDAVTSLVFVSVDTAMVGHAIRQEVIKQLSESYGDLYSEKNVLISATHTHSAPGGHMKDVLFDISSLGFDQQNFKAILSGIILSIKRAHQSLVRGQVYVAQGELLDANINRSPSAYLNNPASERSRYKYDVDKTILQLQLIREDGHPVGVINWFAVHPTSMNNTNVLVSSDNVGLASILFEQRMNPNALIGKGPFVAAFASSNLGDVSPNIKGPHCQQTGGPCNDLKSTCLSFGEMCVAFGPGKDMFDSTRIIAQRLFNKAWELWNSKDRNKISGDIQVVHQYIDMPTQEADYLDPENGVITRVHGCMPAMGMSFAAGTTDGPGLPFFHQGMVNQKSFWNLVRNLLKRPPPEQIRCHAPKPIFLYTGEMDFPYEWQPRIVSTQLAVLGNMVVACVPGEFTTMAGRRVRDILSSEFGITTQQIIIAGLCNIYSDYITTPEEYQVQRYEGASTIFGPYTLNIYLKQFKKLAVALKQGTALEPGPAPPLQQELKLPELPVLYDTPKWFYSFGDCLLQPQKNAYPGDTVVTLFVSGHPKNNLRHEHTYLAIEILDDKQWKVVATDANYETRFEWIRLSSILGTSEVRITWTIGENVRPGTYRIRHFGNYKTITNNIHPYEGRSEPFKVQRRA